MVEDAELQALEEAIAANPQESIMGADAAPDEQTLVEAVQPEPSTAESKPEDSGLEEVYNQSPTPEELIANDQLPPQEVRENDEELRKWLASRTTSAITKIRQKEKPKVQEYLQSLTVDDVAPPMQPQQVDAPKSIEDILKPYSEDQREDLAPAVDVMRKVTQLETKPLNEMYQQILVNQRSQLEASHLNEFKTKYDGFPLTQDMVKKAQDLRKQYPNETYARCLLHANADAINDWKLDKKVDARLAQIQANQIPEHPGAQATASDARTPKPLDLNSMSNEDVIKLLEEKIGFAEQ